MVVQLGKKAQISIGQLLIGVFVMALATAFSITFLLFMQGKDMTAVNEAYVDFSGSTRATTMLQAMLLDDRELIKSLPPQAFQTTRNAILSFMDLYTNTNCKQDKKGVYEVEVKTSGGVITLCGVSDPTQVYTAKEELFYFGKKTEVTLRLQKNG